MSSFLNRCRSIVVAFLIVGLWAAGCVGCEDNPAQPDDAAEDENNEREREVEIVSEDPEVDVGETVASKGGEDSEDFGHADDDDDDELVIDAGETDPADFEAESGEEQEQESTGAQADEEPPQDVEPPESTNRCPEGTRCGVEIEMPETQYRDDPRRGDPLEGDPHVEWGTPQVDGSLDPAVVEDMLDQHQSKFQNCYEFGLERGDLLGPEETRTVTWTVSATGEVDAVRIENSLDRRAVVNRCFRRRIWRLSFSEPSDGKAVTVSVPVELSY